MPVTKRQQDGTFIPTPSRITADTDQSHVAEVIGRIVDATNLSVSEIAKRAGIAPSTLTRMYPNPSVKYTLSARTLRKLDQAFPDDPAYPSVERPSRAPSRLREEPSGYAAPPASGIPIFRLGPSLAETDVRPDAFELFEGDLDLPIGRWNGLPTIAGDPMFLVYMPGDGMAPRIDAGEALLIDRLRPPALRSDILAEIARADGSTAYCIGILAERDRDGVTLAQLRDAVSLTLRHGEIKQLLRIAARFDAAGL